MNKVWYLSTCNTCQRIIEELSLKEKGFTMQDVKDEIISEKDLDQIKNTLNCSYEDLFNKRSIKYSKTNLKGSFKEDIEYKKAILNEYTFMKRPIIQIGNKYFVGNAKKTIDEAKSNLK